MYQIQKQFLLALKTDSTSDAVIQALHEGTKPVIALENTGESTIQHFDAKSHGSDFKSRYGARRYR